jgi:hypothetical protein
LQQQNSKQQQSEYPDAPQNVNGNPSMFAFPAKEEDWICFSSLRLTYFQTTAAT